MRGVGGGGGFGRVGVLVDGAGRVGTAGTGQDVSDKVGTMIEVPRAALRANRIALNCDFFSFGTNDLTQMTFGFSRDDAGKFLVPYLEQKILAADPFETLDQQGVGRLMKMAGEAAEQVRPDIQLGIRGEHVGDPGSIHLCHSLGLNYVSCSPFRVPVARLAAAQAAIGDSASSN